MNLGTAKLPITPAMPVRLCGYGYRTELSTKTVEDVCLRVFYLTDGERRLVFLYGDLIWWSPSFVARARAALAERYGLKEKELCFVASHNHSGPPTGGDFTPALETFCPEYAAWLLERVLAGVADARGNLEPVRAARCDGNCNINVFRRVKTANGVEMRPNYEVAADRQLTILRFTAASGAEKGFLVHYPCHANAANGYEIHPDYPGMALRMLDEAFPGSTAMFLQGCTADLRPNSVTGDRFVPCDPERTKLLAEIFFDSCMETLSSPGREVPLALSVERSVTELPLVQTFTREEVEAAAVEDSPDRQWAQAVLAKGLRPTERLDVYRIALGDGYVLFTLNAEVVQFYARFVRQICPGAVTAAYANGMIGYLCTSEQIAEGGYEPFDSAKGFALAGTYSPEIEKRICGVLRDLNGGMESGAEKGGER